MDIIVTTPTAIAAALGTAALTLLGEFIIRKFDGRQRRLESDVAIKTENLALQKLVTMLQESHSDAVAAIEKRHAEEISRYQVANGELQKQVLESEARYERVYSHDAVKAKYSFSHWGTSKIGSSHFCTHCLSVAPQLEIQLIERQDKMTCPHCATVYHSPYAE